MLSALGKLYPNPQVNQRVYGAEVGKRYVLATLKSLGKLKVKMNGWWGGTQERNTRLRTEVGCRLDTTRDLASELRLLVITVFILSERAPAKSRVFISLTCVTALPEFCLYCGSFFTNYPLSSCHLH